MAYSPFTPRLLGPGDAVAYRELRLLGLQESPAAFGSSHAQESARNLEFFEGRVNPTADQWVLGILSEAGLVGVAGFVRDGGVKTRHKGCIWGMYVHPDWRGRGIGRQIMIAALARIDATPGLRWVRLSVTAGNTAALKLYESSGFVRYGEEPEALLVDGVYYATHYLVRRTPTG